MPQHRHASPLRHDNLPPQPFFHTPEQRTMLARQRFFEEGERPAGLVSDLVLQSWSRCLGQGRSPAEKPSFDPVTRSRVSAVLARNHTLLEVAAPELSQLDSVLSGSRAKAMLVDRNGLVIRATQADPNDGALLHLSCRTGVDLSEVQMGTTAPGVAASTRRTCTVQGPEHFFADIQTMYCAAAPIHDRRGQLVGVLDLSIQNRSFGFDAASLVNLTATSIENRLLAHQSRDMVLLRFQSLPTLISTPMQGMAAIGLDGKIAWINAAAAGQLGCRQEEARGRSAVDVMGLDLTEWLQRADRAGTQSFRTPAGLVLWASVELPHRGGHARFVADAVYPASAIDTRERRTSADVPPSESAEPASTGSDAQTASAASDTETASLATAGRRVIERTLAACGGNVSRAARALGVSRGLLYRRLRQPLDRSDAAED